MAPPEGSSPASLRISRRSVSSPTRDSIPEAERSMARRHASLVRGGSPFSAKRAEMGTREASRLNGFRFEAYPSASISARYSTWSAVPDASSALKPSLLAMNLSAPALSSRSSRPRGPGRQAQGGRRCGDRVQAAACQGGHGRLRPGLLPRGGGPPRPQHDVEHDSVVGGVQVVPVSVPVRRVHVQLHVSDDTAARIVLEHGVHEVGARAGVRTAGVDDGKPPAVLGDQPVRQGVRPAPQGGHRALRGAPRGPAGGGRPVFHGLAGRPAGVYRKGGAGDRPRLVGGEEAGEGGDLLRLDQPLDRRVGEHHLLDDPVL